MKFCVKCGKDIHTGVFCLKCKTPEVKFQDLSLKVCACRRVYDRGQWLPKDLNILVRDLIHKQAKAEVTVNLEWNNLLKGKNLFKVKVEHQGEQHRVPLCIAVQQCDLCQRMKSGYFEGVLQLRNSSDEVELFVEREVEANREKGIFIAKRVPYKNGIDLYLSDQHFLQSLGKKLYAAFGGVKKVNARIHTFDNARSKDVYRMTVLVEFPNFKSGDVIKMGESLIWVQEVKKDITGFDIKLHKKLKFAFKDPNIQILPKYKTHVTKLHPHLEVINPLDYQSIMVKNKVPSAHTNQEVQVVIDKGVYVVE
ncbi:MAG TPA: NMD3-related protein [Candidatus Nanoarchaeia archaeon]|nr:NMD3-related protein [Candidatus Nanoarchaeia archaeon]